MLMASCSFSSMFNAASSCGQSHFYKSTITCIPLIECTKDASSHFRTLKVFSDKETISEMKLLLARAGVFRMKEAHKSLTICPRHRDTFGLRWRCNRKYCAVPKEIACHKQEKVKGDRGIDFELSAMIFHRMGIVIPIGSPVCRRCRQHIKGTPNLSTVGSSDSDSASKADESLVKKAITSSSSSLDDLGDQLQQLSFGIDQSYLPSSETASTASSASGEERDIDDQKLKLNNFLESCNIDPIGTKRWLAWSSATERTRKRYVSFAGDAVAAVLNVLSAEDAGLLWEALQSSNVVNEKLNLSSYSLLPSQQKFIEALAESYKIADSWETRRQILSIMAGITSYKAVCEFIPGLTTYRYSIASLHRLQHGPGAPMPVAKTTRLRVDRCQLDHFLGFITSPHLVQDLPFGEKVLNLSDGGSVTVPNVIRTLIPQRVVQQYKLFCVESGFKPFSDSTMLRVLTACSASVRKSVQGLDYYAAEGSRAFEDLTQVVRLVSSLGSGQPSNWEKDTCDALKAGKMYLKGDYKVHVSEDSCVPDHCSVYAVSDPTDKCMMSRCIHSHSEHCGQCENLDEILDSVQKSMQEAKFFSSEDRDEALYLCQHAREAIFQWKCHQIRTVRQDTARLDAIDRLDETTCLITSDWAMKFIPQKFRESQSDWFGKRGISWHISVVVRRVNGLLQSQSFVHILQSSNQNSTAVIFLLEHALRTLRSEHPEITSAYLRSDNAGCYHSTTTILAIPAIQKSSGISIVAVNFSDPQGGKGSADRMAATCKNHIRRYINEGHDVTSAQQMKDALLSSGGIEGVRISVVDATIPETPDQARVTGISKLNNFDYRADGILARRAYMIGGGKLITTNEGVKDVQLSWLKEKFSDGEFKSLSKAVSSGNSSVQETCAAVTEKNATDETQRPVYCCPQDGCTRVFQRHSALEKHMSYEKCTKSAERASLYDIAKREYATKLIEGVGKIPIITETKFGEAFRLPLKEGWALKQAKKKYRFNDKKKKYLTDKFNIGLETGKKADSEAVAKEMRRARDANGERMFSMSEFLSSQQVSSFFSRLAAKSRKPISGESVEESDILSAVEEANFASAREAVLTAVGVTHPIVVNQYNVCDMEKKGSLSKQKVTVLQHLCDELELNVPNPPVHRKYPYLVLLKDLVNECNCKET